MTNLPHLAAGIGVGVCLGHLLNRYLNRERPPEAKAAARPRPQAKRRPAAGASKGVSFFSGRLFARRSRVGSAGTGKRADSLLGRVFSTRSRVGSAGKRSGGRRRWTPPLLLGSLGGAIQIPLHSSQFSLVSFDLEFLGGLLRDWAAKLF